MSTTLLKLRLKSTLFTPGMEKFNCRKKNWQILQQICVWKNRKYIFSKNFRESSKVELVCLVHAQPKATIHWFKNSVQLTEDNVTLEKIGHKNTLTIPSLSHSDYGNYTCRAKNIHGESSKVLEVSGMFLWNLIPSLVHV